MTWKLSNLTKLTKILTVSSITLTVGCTLPEDEVDLTLTPSTYEKIDNHAWSELEKIDINNYRTGQYVHYEYNIRGDLSAVFKSRDQVRQIIDVATVDENTKLKIAFEEFNQYYDENGVSEQKLTNPIWKFDFNQPNMSSFGRQLVQAKLGLDINSDKETEFKYYNYKMRKVSIDPPLLISQQDDCGGLSPCKINGIEQNFILKIFENGQETFKAEVKQVLSHQVPPVYLFDTPNVYPMVSECYTYLYEKTLVSDCKVLRDMQW